MTRARKRILIVLVLSLVMVLATFTALKLYSSGLEPVYVSFQPSMSTHQIDSFFDIYLVFEDYPEEPLDAFRIYVNFNKPLMEVMEVSPGPAIPGQDIHLFSYGETPMGIVIEDYPPNGIPLNQATGLVIAIIHFHCISVGDSYVVVDPISVFWDLWGGPHAAIQTGACLVHQVYPTANTSIQPSTIAVPYSSPFTANVNVQGVTNLWMYQLVLNYNTAYMDALDIVPGDFLPSPTILQKVIDDNTGTILFDVQSGIMQGISGDGTLATISFHCTAPGQSALTITSAIYTDPFGFNIPTTTTSGTINQYMYWEPVKLQNIVELPYSYALVDLPFVPPGSPAGYAEIRSLFESKGYMFDIDSEGSKWYIDSFFDIYTEMRPMEELDGTITSWWSSNMLEDGTKACLLSAEMADGTSMAMGFITNVLPPEQMPGVDPYIIWNAEPYFFVQFYWWSWNPVNRIVTWSYWWHDSHNHPNWFWGVYWWWRTYTKAYYLGYWPPIDINWAYWRPWWGWWWHWVYWQHWHWWSTYFPYDP